MNDEINIEGLLNKKSNNYFVVAQKEHITGKWVSVTKISFFEDYRDEAFKKIVRRYHLWKNNDGNDHENIKLFEVNVHNRGYDIKEIIEV